MIQHINELSLEQEIRLELMADQKKDMIIVTLDLRVHNKIKFMWL